MKNHNLRLLLFDIDGTLLSTRGIPRLAMERVLKKKFNKFIYDDNYNYSGRTDWEIVEHLLDFAGIEFKRDFDSLQKIFSAFADELEFEIKNGLIPHIYPNVLELLEKLKKELNITPQKSLNQKVYVPRFSVPCSQSYEIVAFLFR